MVQQLLQSVQVLQSKSLTLAIISGILQFHTEQSVPNLLDDMTAAARQAAGAMPKFAQVKVTLHLGKIDCTQHLLKHSLTDRDKTIMYLCMVSWPCRCQPFLGGLVVCLQSSVTPEGISQFCPPAL